MTPDLSKLRNATEDDVICGRKLERGVYCDREPGHQGECDAMVAIPVLRQPQG